ncbi:histidine kinase dimerization/phosphoacceptor domain-containing protein, partial [Micromonospora sp. CPCC 205371]|nr:histidine kinase dimerization/phosphoacceptor domain-containing protein [Micromonospora sp. CPCC 205371]
MAGELAGAAEPSGATAALTAPVAIGCLIMGTLVAGAAPGRRVGGLLIAAGAVACVAVVALSWSRWLPLAWLGQWSWWPPYGLVFLALLVFPDGRLPSRRWRIVAVAIAAGVAVTSAALAIAALDHPRNLLTEVIDFSDRARLFVRVAAVGVAITAAGMLATVYSQWLRWRRASGTARQQLACLLAAGLVFLVGLVLDAANLPGAQVVVGLSIPLGMTVAMLRHRLYGLDQVVNRVIVWSVMTILVIIGFVAIVAVLRTVVTGERTSMASLAVTGLIAVLFEPLRRLVQRGVDRLLFGDRDDPYRVIARLGDLIGRTVEPNAVLPTLTGTIAQSLQVPYVAVRLPADGAPQLLTEHGSATTDVELFDMTLHGRRVGRLLVATRGPDSPFTARERRLLSQLAVQAAAAAEAARLIHELQDARERLVRTREEERRRLRRDLHDGLGPALAGMSMQVGAAKNLTDEPVRVGRILAALADDLRTCTAEVRRLVDELRPPALDDGLEAALRGEC